MELRKQREIEYYDKKAEGWLTGKRKARGDFEGFDSSFLSSYKFCYDWLKKNCQNKIVLDYGCGNGIHSISLAKMGAKVIGIDLSEKSLEIAKERIIKEGLKGKIKFIPMDCEKMEFPDNYFDIIFDGGTFSSLDLRLVYPELVRVLKPGGSLIGVETFGHNPITNLKRKINKLTGKRTEWAAEHIFRMEDLEKAKNYFGRVEVKFFHLISWFVFPLFFLPAAKFLLRLFEGIDKLLLKNSFLRKYAFKIVLIFSLPRKK